MEGEGGGGGKRYGCTENIYSIIQQRHSQITASVQTLNDSVHKQFIQGKNKNRIQLQKTTMFIALASVQQRRTEEDKSCHKITEKGYLKTKDNKTTDRYTIQ